MKCFNRVINFNFLLLALCLASTTASASIIIGGTRVVYPASNKEVTVKLSNVGTAPVLIQSWIDNGDTEARPEDISVPFTLTPPINRVEPGKGQMLRLAYTGASLPSNKESIFWLNVLEIPAKATPAPGKENFLQMAFRSRIKLFFRPDGLPGNPDEAPSLLNWTSAANGISVKNPTPYYISMASIKVNGKEIPGTMVAPDESKLLSLPSASPGSKVNFIFINDYGATHKVESFIH